MAGSVGIAGISTRTTETVQDGIDEVPHGSRTDPKPRGEYRLHQHNTCVPRAGRASYRTTARINRLPDTSCKIPDTKLGFSLEDRANCYDTIRARYPSESNWATAERNAAISAVLWGRCFSSASRIRLKPRFFNARIAFRSLLDSSPAELQTMSISRSNA
jgi:hypothetical protein